MTSSLMSAAAMAGPVAAGWGGHWWWLRRQLDRARRDPLTGLRTRCGFEQRAARLLRSGPQVLVLIDLDGFKAVNDQLGHAAGDLALREAARRMTHWITTRCPGGLVARLGGDEFALVLPARTPEALRVALEDLHQRLCFPLDDSTARVHLGASIGAFTPATTATGMGVGLRRADEAMYEAKRAGGGVHLAAGPDSVCGSVNGRRVGRRGGHYTLAHH